MWPATSFHFVWLVCLFFTFWRWSINVNPVCTASRLHMSASISLRTTITDLEFHSLFYDGVCYAQEIIKGESLQRRPSWETQQTKHVQPMILGQVLTSYILQHRDRVLYTKAVKQFINEQINSKAFSLFFIFIPLFIFTYTSLAATIYLVFVHFSL